jgi:hypothetical protein
MQRCDGERPYCMTCSQVGKAGSCEYEEGQTYTMALLEKTKALEERLAAMEDQQLFQNPSPPVGVPDLVPSDFSDSPRM